MRTLLIGCAAVAATALAAAPAQAQFSGNAFASAPQTTSSSHGVRVTRGHGGDGDHHGHGGTNIVVGNWSGGAWALYNNRTWEPDSYNDWWHERPDRAFPRWISNNHGCERTWWSGGAFRC